MYSCIVITEGEFEEKYDFHEVGELAAFQLGVYTGANLYGAGSCGAFTKDDLEDDKISDEYKALIRKHL